MGVPGNHNVGILKGCTPASAILRNSLEQIKMCQSEGLERPGFADVCVIRPRI